MAYVADHLSVTGLEERYEACDDVTSSRHFQTIWLLAKGHTVGEVAAMTSFGRRWIEQLLERYNALGPLALGDLRRGNGAAARILKPELLLRNQCCRRGCTSRRNPPGAPPRYANRDIRDRRTSARAEAGNPPGLGADRGAADRARPPSL